MIKYWLVSLIILALNLFVEYHENYEFYWFMVSVLNKKITLVLVINFFISTFLFFITTIQNIFFGKELMEGEKLVK